MPGAAMDTMLWVGTGDASDSTSVLRALERALAADGVRYEWTDDCGELTYLSWEVYADGGVWASLPADEDGDRIARAWAKALGESSSLRAYEATHEPGAGLLERAREIRGDTSPAAPAPALARSDLPDGFDAALACRHRAGVAHRSPGSSHAFRAYRASWVHPVAGRSGVKGLIAEIDALLGQQGEEPPSERGADPKLVAELLAALDGRDPIVKTRTGPDALEIKVAASGHARSWEVIHDASWSEVEAKLSPRARRALQRPTLWPPWLIALGSIKPG